VRSGAGTARAHAIGRTDALCQVLRGMSHTTPWIAARVAGQLFMTPVSVAASAVGDRGLSQAGDSSSGNLPGAG
jgi:hypothetical protein